MAGLMFKLHGVFVLLVVLRRWFLFVWFCGDRPMEEPFLIIMFWSLYFIYLEAIKSIQVLVLNTGSHVNGCVKTFLLSKSSNDWLCKTQTRIVLQSFIMELWYLIRIQ